MVDAIVIGAGPNGLVAGAVLARHGRQVLVLEAKDRPGGALYSVENTLPGYIHDVGAAFFPFALDSPAFRFLDLTSAGVAWCHARRDSCHPAPDGSCVSISRYLELSIASFGSDGPAWSKFVLWHQRMGDWLADVLLVALYGLSTALRLGTVTFIKLARVVLSCSVKLSRSLFESEAARRVMTSLGLHVELGPEDFAGAGLGLVLSLLASSAGFPVPGGGARSITHALIRRLEE